MAEKVPPIPYKIPVVNAKGFLSEPWDRWFRHMFNRIGGPGEVATNAELQAAPLDLVALQAQVATLQTQATNLQASINELYGLGQGPVL